MATSPHKNSGSPSTTRAGLTVASSQGACFARSGSAAIVSARVRSAVCFSDARADARRRRVRSPDGVSVVKSARISRGPDGRSPSGIVHLVEMQVAVADRDRRRHA